MILYNQKFVIIINSTFYFFRCKTPQSFLKYQHKYKFGKKCGDNANTNTQKDRDTKYTITTRSKCKISSLRAANDDNEDFQPNSFPTFLGFQSSKNGLKKRFSSKFNSWDDGMIILGVWSCQVGQKGQKHSSSAVRLKVWEILLKHTLN